MGVFMKELLFLLNVFTLMHGKPSTIQKCCPKGLQLDAEIKSCIEVSGHNVSSETEEVLNPPIDLVTNYWVHPALQSYSLLTYYLDSISTFKLDVTATNVFPKQDFQLLEFKGEINPLLVLRERYCYDRTPNNESEHVQVRTVSLKRMFKCCSKGERLNMTSNECQRHRDLPVDSSLKQEIVGLPRGEDYSWLPPNISEYVLKIKYRALQSGEDYNVRVAADEGFSWRLMPSESDRETIIWFRGGRSDSGGAVTDAFCFDEDAEGGRRVLLAALYDAFKCCGRDEQMKDVHRVCAPTEADSGRRDWLPEALQSRDTALHVRYDAIFPMSAYRSHKGFIYNESLWRMERASNVSLPRLIVNLTELSGNELIVNTTRFCFDYLRDSTRVVVMHIPYLEDSIRKCCFPGEIFSERGVCVKNHEALGWTPRDSKVNALFKQSIPRENLFYPTKYYCSTKFHLLPRDSPRALQHFEGSHYDHLPRFVSEYCNEWQLQADGGVEEVVAFCNAPEYAATYEKVLPLSLVSAVLLVLAGGLALANEEMRRSGHGLSLACHAFCLAAADSLHVAVFYQWPMLDDDCTPFMYFTYFFMVAANWWLTVITFNIFYTFRQPLGAMAAGAGGAGAASSSGVWKKRFGLLSLAAWSGSLALTVVAVTVHRFRIEVLKSGFAAPSFLETRTCAFDDLFHTEDDMTWPLPLGSPQGSVFYYLIPMTLLSCANLLCVTLTARRVSHLRRGNSILKRAAAANNHRDSAGVATPAPVACLPQQHMEMALLYAKLLLTSGVAELSLETAVWVFGRKTQFLYAANGKVLLTATSEQYLFASAFAFVDVARALLVFWLSVGRNKRAEQAKATAWAWAKGAWDKTWTRCCLKLNCHCCAANSSLQPPPPPPPPQRVTMSELQAKDTKED